MVENWGLSTKENCETFN